MALDDLDISALKDRFPLPEGVEDCEASLSDLEPVLNVSTNTLTDWHRNEGMPVKQQGGNGRAYVFQLSEVWAWHKHRDETRARTEDHKRAQLKALHASLFPEGEEPDDTATMTDAQRKAFYDAQILYTRTEEFRESYCARDDVRQAFDALLMAIRDPLLSFPDMLEREAAATPSQVELSQKVVDRMLMQLHQEVTNHMLTAPLTDKRDQPVQADQPLLA